MARSWVFIDETKGATTKDGGKITPNVLLIIAQACFVQMESNYRPECGGEPFTFRVGMSPTDIKPGESVFAYHATLPEAPDAVAYHDKTGKGVPYAVMAITDCDSLFGPGDSASVSASHEILESEGNEGCNQFADRDSTTSVAHERCDAVEVQTYPVSANGVKVYVSNFVLDAFFDPGSPGPYTYMGKHEIAGAVEPKAPMTCAEGEGGNYQILRSIRTGKEAQETSMHHYGIEGNPRRAKRHHHFSSRFARIAGHTIAE